ncbi:hypothetical protein ACU4GD_09945 [Cupriavidus basilensis]
MLGTGRWASSWTPCAGPVLGFHPSSHWSPGRRTWGVPQSSSRCSPRGAARFPMLAIAYGGRLVTTRGHKVARHAHHLQRGFGAIVAATAVAAVLPV